MKTTLKRKLISSSMILGGLAAFSVSHAAVLEEIIVTAQKRAQNVRDVAATINVISGDTIDELNLLSFADLERVTSGLQLVQANPRNVTISLRGVTVDPESGTGSAVDVYQNNVVQRGDTIFGAIYDLERVEVLRGAQGSVQGSTSPAGAILLHTKKADLDGFNGYVAGSYSNTNSGINLQGAVNLPLIKDKMALRIAAFDDSNDQNGIRNAVTDRVQDSSITSFRASLNWAASENLDINLVHQNNDKTVYGSPQVVGSRDFASAFAGVNVLPCFLAKPVTAQVSCQTYGRDDRAALSRTDSFTESDQDITTLNVDWSVGGHKVSYIFGNTDTVKASRTERDRSNNFPLQQNFLALLGVQNDTNYLTHQGSTTTVDAEVHELRIESVDNDKWNYMFGAYSQEQNTSTAFTAWSVIPYIPFSAILGPGVPGHIEGINFSTTGVIPFNREVTAFFTDHSFQLSENTKLEVGLRYQEIDRFNTTNIVFGEFNQPETISAQGFPSPFAPFIVQGLLGSIAATNIVGIPEEFQSPSSDSTTGSIRLSHDFSDNLTSYVTYSTAYRSGGISITPGADLGPADLLFDEEDSELFEIGAKGIYLDGAAEVNIALFRQSFDGFLGYVTDLDYVTRSGAIAELTGGLVFNGDATMTGIDLDWRMVTGDNWLWGGSLSYVDAKFDDAQVPCNQRAAGERVGRCASSSRIAGSPELSANLFGEYTFTSDNVEYFARANAKYNGGIVSTRAVEFGNEAGETPSFLLVDMFFGVRTENWELSLFAKNLLDEDADLDFTNPGDNYDINSNFTEVRIMPRRTFGVSARYEF